MNTLGVAALQWIEIKTGMLILLLELAKAQEKHAYESVFFFHETRIEMR